jgi:hypothetical protein
MNITRNTRRADGLTVGEAMDRDAAFLRSLGFDAKDGQPTFDEQREALTDKCREAVLAALDGVAAEVTGNRENGPKDGELARLFDGVDAIADRMFWESILDKRRR